MIVVERCVPFNTIHNFQFVLHPSAHWRTEWHTPSAEFIIWFFIISCLRCRFKNWDWIELWIVNMCVVSKQKYLPPCAWREINEGSEKDWSNSADHFLDKRQFQIPWHLDTLKIKPEIDISKFLFIPIFTSNFYDNRWLGYIKPLDGSFTNIFKKNQIHKKSLACIYSIPSLLQIWKWITVF